ncbi:alpha-amylase family glycosyl hydrolase [Actinoplanes sp. N902-109]|uniref:alpha-amylase family glycosyl hydrolase n=1 Tax=Actinoplanes sp. (strain N902-109) TaxID=649831 RepID=UPI0003293EF9|nr:alpha-amylase family glycosyl hydrolase [Actinoplanes sp. N902-109]AGL16370.1 alpha amylase, catalytic region [Actinoplanes sp. N902-109]
MGRDEWWRGAVLYQIYPRSFADSDGDGIGDLRGVISRLDHLRDGTPASLGVDAIWLSPFYPSPLADFGYDISDYQDVDPAYGSLDDFDELVAEAHRRDIRVIVDLVMNHTSTRHPWFVESRAGRDSARRDWYIWADPGPGGGPPNNWLSAFERCGSAWSYDPLCGQFYLHSFTPGQPDLNLRNPSVREALRSVWRFWLDRGVDGFRVDVAHRLVKDAALRDNPAEIAHARRHVMHPAVRQVNMDLPEVHEILADLRTTVDAYPGRFTLGEVPVADDGRLVDYFGGTGMQTAFHIAFWEQPWDASAFRATVDRMAGLMRPGALPTYALATHDISRTVSRFGNRQRARVAAMMMLTLRGLACVYYGEEIGMSDAPPPPGRELDVDGRDGQRTPMQWDATGQGFTRGTPWLAFGPDLRQVNVEAQTDDPQSLLSLYRRLIWFRRGSAALRAGDYQSLDSPPGTFVYLRTCAEERLLVALNLTDAEVEVPGIGSGRIELSTHPGRDGAAGDGSSLPLAAGEGVIFRPDRE